MLSPVGQTARWVAAVRAVESERRDALIRDPYARALAGEEGFEMLWRTSEQMEQGGGEIFLASLAIRSRFLDDQLMKAVAGGIRQIVILAAGLDARAFRLHFPSGTRLWELDQPAIFELKQSILEPMRPKTGCSRHVVSVDLREDWPPRLLESGFDPTIPAAFIIEGLLIYLESDQVHQLLDRVSAIAAQGSWLGCDVPGIELLESPFMAKTKEWMERQGSPFVFGVSNPEALFEQHGWIARCSMLGDPDASYGRWPLPPVDRSIPGIPRSYLISAWKQ